MNTVHINFSNKVSPSSENTSSILKDSCNGLWRICQRIYEVILCPIKWVANLFEKTSSITPSSSSTLENRVEPQTTIHFGKIASAASSLLVFYMGYSLFSSKAATPAPSSPSTFKIPAIAVSFVCIAILGCYKANRYVAKNSTLNLKTSFANTQLKQQHTKQTVAASTTPPPLPAQNLSIEEIILKVDKFMEKYGENERVKLTLKDNYTTYTQRPRDRAFYLKELTDLEYWKMLIHLEVIPSLRTHLATVKEPLEDKYLMLLSKLLAIQFYEPSRHLG